MKHLYAFKRYVLASFILLLSAIGVTATANAQGLIRDAEIEKYLREWTDPILTVAGLNLSLIHI